MKAKHFITPILVVAFVTNTAAPPTHAELVTLTLILAAAFASGIFGKEILTSKPALQ
jgi:hypothetical protein